MKGEHAGASGAEQQATLEWVPVDQLTSHPENPRLVVRVQVVTDLARAMAGSGFRVEHAILAAPDADGDGLVIVSGHHRVEAARRAGLRSVPAWVRAMTADEQFMGLLLSNRQGELSPLEVGMHALRYVERAAGGRGRKGGLSEYAELIGRSKQHVAELRAAAQVAETVRSSGRFSERLSSADVLLDKAKHLYEVSRTVPALWPILIDRLLAEQWSAADTRGRVAAAQDAYDSVPEVDLDALNIRELVIEPPPTPEGSGAGPVEAAWTCDDDAPEEVAAPRMGVHYSSQTDQWGTPQDLFDLLDGEFHFAVDVCATAEVAKCERHYTPEQDGLAQEWTGTCWMNPPYGEEIVRWVRKAAESAQAGATVVCLVPARVDTGWWWDYCRCGEVRFLRGRLKFGGGATGAPFPSAVVVMSPNHPAGVVWWERSTSLPDAAQGAAA